MLMSEKNWDQMSKFIKLGGMTFSIFGPVELLLEWQLVVR